MDKGLWNGDPPGSSPAHMTAWHKIQLGFISGSMLAIANPGVPPHTQWTPRRLLQATCMPLRYRFTTHLKPQPILLGRSEISNLASTPHFPAAGVLITYVDNTAIIGRVHVMDGHPSVADLKDAVWNVGQTFTRHHPQYGCNSNRSGRKLLPNYRKQAAPVNLRNPPKPKPEPTSTSQ